MFATTEEIISLVGREPSPWTSARFYGVTALGSDDKTPVLVMGHLLFLAPGQEEAPVIPSIRLDPLVTIGLVELDLKTAVDVMRDLEAWKWPARLAETNVFGRNVILPGAPGAWTPEKRTQGHYQPRLIARRHLSGQGHNFGEATKPERFDQVTEALQRGSPSVSGLQAIATKAGMESPDAYRHMGGNLQYQMSAILPVRLDLGWDSGASPTAIVTFGHTIEPNDLEFSVADGESGTVKVGEAFVEEAESPDGSAPRAGTPNGLRVVVKEYANLKANTSAYLWWRGWKVAEANWSNRDDAIEWFQLDRVAAEVEQGSNPRITGRDLLSWFGASRRGSRVVARIRAELARRRLTTVPDFMDVWVDVPLLVKRLEQVEAEDAPQSLVEVDESAALTASTTTAVTEIAGASDPIRRIKSLRAANQAVTSVRPHTKLQEATTIMMLNDYSQLPVLQSERECKGVISWESIAFKAALGKSPQTVEDCLIPQEEVEQISGETDLLEAIPKIARKGFALVRGPDRRFVGIVTVVDLSLQFNAISEPFLLLEQIERLLRVHIQSCFTVDELRQVLDPSDPDRKVEGADNLSFGEYVRLVEDPDKWKRLRFAFDRGQFVSVLKRVNEFRNDVMHFDPQPADSADIERLRLLAKFLKGTIVGR